MIAPTTSQHQTNNFQPVFTEEHNGGFNAPATTKKNVSYHDFMILDFSKVEGNESKENQDKNIKSSQNTENYSEKFQTEENIQFESQNVDIEFSEFNHKFSFEIVDTAGDEFSEQIIFKLEYADRFFVQLKLNGYWELGEEPKFQLNDVDWVFEEKKNTPTSAFFLETFKAILCLSNKVKVDIPTINYYFESAVPLPLNAISEMLQNRQLAYRLMVIEKAFQIALPFPRRCIKGEEVENIAFCYHAIVDREFDWSLNPTTIPWIANEESFSWLPETDKPTSLIFGPEFFEQSIFGIEIPLGVLTAKIEKAVIDNYEEVKANLSKLDGNTVEVKLRSLNGMNRIIAVKVPTLPENPWSGELQKLIDLDKKLDSTVLDKYFALAASTLEGLTEEQKEAILERPKLDEDAFTF